MLQQSVFFSNHDLLSYFQQSSCVQHPQKPLNTKFDTNCSMQSALLQNAANLQQNAAFYSKLAFFVICMVSIWGPHPKNIPGTKFEPNHPGFSQNAADLQQNAAFYSKLAIFEMCTVSRIVPHPKKTPGTNVQTIITFCIWPPI